MLNLISNFNVYGSKSDLCWHLACAACMPLFIVQIMQSAFPVDSEMESSYNKTS